MGKSEEETKETEKKETEEETEGENEEYSPKSPPNQTYLLTESKCEFE